MNLQDIGAVYSGSNGDATKALYEKLKAVGPLGVIAMNLFRVCKTSGRAKDYRGRQRGGQSYRAMAYEKKNWSMDQLATALQQHGTRMGLSWGWGLDEPLRRRGDPHHHILYVDLPAGQVSFHTGTRGAGADYVGVWDRVRDAAGDRICRFCEVVLSGSQFEPTKPNLMDPGGAETLTLERAGESLPAERLLL
jgi:hypothetical protein